MVFARAVQFVHAVHVSKGKFESKISPLAPAAIKLKVCSHPGNKGKTDPAALAHRPIPSLVRIKHLGRMATDPYEFTIRDSDHVKIEVVQRIAKIPLPVAPGVVGPIPLGRKRVIKVSPPESRAAFDPVWNVNSRIMTNCAGDVLLAALVGNIHMSAAKAQGHQPQNM